MSFEDDLSKYRLWKKYPAKETQKERSSDQIDGKEIIKQGIDENSRIYGVYSGLINMARKYPEVYLLFKIKKILII